MSKGKDDTNLLSVLEQVKTGSMNPKRIPKEMQTGLVGLLIDQGLHIPEIAMILKCSDRTVQRHKAELLAQLALDPNPDLARQLSGRLIQVAEQVMANLRRIGRDKATPAASRIDAEANIFQVMAKLVEKLQSLGYLPLNQGLALDASLRDGPIDVSHIIAEVTTLRTVSSKCLAPEDPARKDLEKLDDAINPKQGGTKRGRATKKL